MRKMLKTRDVEVIIMAMEALSFVMGHEFVTVSCRVQTVNDQCYREHNVKTQYRTKIK